MTCSLDEVLADIGPVDAGWHEKARAYHARLTKPPGSLGRLEEVGCRLCAIQRRLPPTIECTQVVVFVGDHGVAADEQVAPYPREVTGQMVANFVRGGAAINALAGVVGAELRVVDIGVAHPVAGLSEGEGLFIRRMARGTRNIAVGPAMTDDQLAEALRVGFEVAEGCVAQGIHAVAIGEMGIGNTTVASAVTAALTGRPASEVTGRGTGADDATLARKIEVVERALAVNQPDANSALDVLRKVGGLEVAGLCGLCLALASRRVAVVTDGFIATAAVALAARLHPSLTDYVFAGHLSPEPGHRLLLQELGRKPLLDLGMRLGEATGAALALKLLQAASAVICDMATFESAGVNDRGA